MIFIKLVYKWTVSEEKNNFLAINHWINLKKEYSQKQQKELRCQLKL